MRMRQRLAAVTLIGGLTTLGIGLTAGVAGANVVTDCPGFLGSAQSGSLHVTGTPAAGSSVPVGSGNCHGFPSWIWLEPHPATAINKAATKYFLVVFIRFLPCGLFGGEGGIRTRVRLLT